MASLLPNSPRARRRLIVAAAVLVAAGAAVLVVLLIPNNHGGIASEGTHGGESAAAPAVTTTAAATTTEHVVGGSRGRLSDVWLLVPLGLLSLIVIVPAVVFTGQWVNDRRVRRRDRDNQPSSCRRFPGATRAVAPRHEGLCMRCSFGELRATMSAIRARGGVA